MITCWDTVRIKHWSSALAWMLYAFEQAVVDDGRDYIISSINDATHLENSKHYRDMAFDFYSLGFNNNAEKEEVRARVEEAMNSQFPGKFTVIIEKLGMKGEHFHCQVTKGQTYP